MEWVPPAVLVILLLWGTMLHKRLATLRQEAISAWPALEARLRRRHDLMTPLAQSLQVLPAKHQKTILRLTQSRNAASIAELSPHLAGKAERALEDAIQKALALAEGFPELEDDMRFQRLIPMLEDAAAEIAAAEAAFNRAVLTYNTACVQTPAILVAKAFNFWKLQYFGMGDDDLEGLLERERGNRTAEPLV